MLFYPAGEAEEAGRRLTPSRCPRPSGARPGPLRGRRAPFPGETTKPRRESRQGTRTKRARSRAASREKTKRLSATDISALASMKNVAKCDTWCELQNPVNHRVFERKLRPKPLGRGHACLGVTHRHPHANAHRGEC